MARLTKKQIAMKSWEYRQLQQLMLLEIEREIESYRKLKPALEIVKVPDLLPYLEASRLILQRGGAEDVYRLLTSKTPSDIQERVIRTGGLFNDNGDWVGL